MIIVSKLTKMDANTNTQSNTEKKKTPFQARMEKKWAETHNGDTKSLKLTIPAISTNRIKKVPGFKSPKKCSPNASFVSPKDYKKTSFF